MTANQDIAKLILRLTLGVLMLMHGIAKLRGGISGIEGMLAGAGLPVFLAPLVYVGEVVAPLMLIAGIYARAAALIILVNMLFALGLAHMHQLFAIGKSGGFVLELQYLFLLNALAICFAGSGRFGLMSKS